MMPILHAEEAMRVAEQIGVGTGSLEARAAGRVVGRWREAIGMERPTAHAMPSTVTAMGIGYQVVEKARG